MKGKDEAPDTLSGSVSPEVQIEPPVSSIHLMMRALSTDLVEEMPSRPEWIDSPKSLKPDELLSNLASLPRCYREEAMVEIYETMILNRGGKELNDLLDTLRPYWASVSDEQRIKWTDNLVRDGLIPLIELMESKGFLISAEKKREINLFLTSAKLSDAELSRITPEDKGAPQPLSATHLSLYGDVNTQATYVKYHEKAVKFALYHIENTIKGPGDVRALMDALARQRRYRALDTDCESAKHFGMERPGESSTNFGTVYEKYKSRIGEGEERITYITIPSIPTPESIPVTKMTPDGWNHLYEGDRDKLREVYENAFFEACRPQATAKEALSKIAGFHWIASHVMLWERGSAAINEQMVDALYRVHFNKSFEKTAGVSLDCEALCQPDVEKYTAFYLTLNSKKDAKLEVSEISAISPPVVEDTLVTSASFKP